MNSSTSTSETIENDLDLLIVWFLCLLSWECCFFIKRILHENVVKILTTEKHVLTTISQKTFAIACLQNN